MNVILGILIPFFGTTFGAGVVFLFKNEINKRVEKILLGFAAGVMIAAAMWSLIIPALNSYENKLLGAFICSLGIICGVAFLMISNRALNISKVDGNMLALAITLHNIPEGMAVGVAFAEVLKGENILVALPLAIGIAVQNIPEGATISLPFRSKGVSTNKAFLYGFLSGVVEPIFALITLVLSSFISSILPFLLSFAAGAMLLVIVEELIPEAQFEEKSSFGTIGVIVGFLIMMILDNIF